MLWRRWLESSFQPAVSVNVRTKATPSERTISLEVARLIFNWVALTPVIFSGTGSDFRLTLWSESILRATLGLRYSPWHSHSLFIAGSAPVWQHVPGIQNDESYRISIGCALGW